MGHVIHGSAHTTAPVCRAIQDSQESPRVLAKRHKVNVSGESDGTTLVPALAAACEKQVAQKPLWHRGNRNGLRNSNTALGHFRATRFTCLWLNLAAGLLDAPP